MIVVKNTLSPCKIYTADMGQKMGRIGLLLVSQLLKICDSPLVLSFYQPQPHHWGGETLGPWRNTRHVIVERYTNTHPSDM